MVASGRETKPKAASALQLAGVDLFAIATGVFPIVADQRVEVRAPIEVVVGVTAYQEIVSSAAVQDGVPSVLLAGLNMVVAGTPAHVIEFTVARHPVVAGATPQIVAVIAALDLVIAAAPLDLVCAPSSIEQVVAVVTQKDVGLIFGASDI